MTGPPRLAEWLLASSLTASERDAVVGDLSEEFSTLIVRQRGELRARWWYRWQVARSLAPLFFRSWERASLTRASIAIASAAVAATVPGVLLIMLRSFVLQQVPLKTTAELSPAFGLALLIVGATSGVLGLACAVRVLRPRGGGPSALI
jgi:hypothetical protein